MKENQNQQQGCCKCPFKGTTTTSQNLFQRIERKREWVITMSQMREVANDLAETCASFWRAPRYLNPASKGHDETRALVATLMNLTQEFMVISDTLALMIGTEKGGAQ